MTATNSYTAPQNVIDALKGQGTTVKEYMEKHFKDVWGVDAEVTVNQPTAKGEVDPAKTYAKEAPAKAENKK